MPSAPPKRSGSKRTRSLDCSLYWLQTWLAPRLAASRRGLVDLLVASSRVGGAHVDRGANLFELEVIGLAGVLDEVDRVLGVAGVTDTLDVRTLVRVVARAGYIEGLIEIGALAFLLVLLGYLGYGRDGSHGQHRQKRRQHHQLLQLTYLLFLSTRQSLRGLAHTAITLSNKSELYATPLTVL